MSEIETLATEVKTIMSGVWRRLFGSVEPLKPLSMERCVAAVQEAGVPVREMFSMKGAAVRKNTPKTVQDAGVRSLSYSELHKGFQLSRADKVAAAFNATAAAVRKDGSLDILRGGVYHG